MSKKKVIMRQDKVISQIPDDAEGQSLFFKRLIKAMLKREKNKKK